MHLIVRQFFLHPQLIKPHLQPLKTFKDCVGDSVYINVDLFDTPSTTHHTITKSRKKSCVFVCWVIVCLRPPDFNIVRHHSHRFLFDFNFMAVCCGYANGGAVRIQFEFIFYYYENCDYKYLASLLCVCVCIIVLSTWRWWMECRCFEYLYVLQGKVFIFPSIVRSKMFQFTDELCTTIGTEVPNGKLISTRMTIVATSDGNS